jgi:ketosteroid isomerase-like protein
MEKRLILAGVMVVCLGLSTGCGRPAGLSQVDLAAVHQAQEDDVRLTNAQDWKGDLALYTEDAILMPPNQAAIQGKAPIQAWMGAYPPISNLQEESLEIVVRGNLAYDRGTYSMTVTHVGAAPLEDHGKYLTIWRKQADESWKISRAIYNSDLPSAPEKPAAKAKKGKTGGHARHRKGAHKN